MLRGCHGLNCRQERFCYAFVSSGCAAAAAEAAGYAARWAANHGYRLLKQGRIRARVADIQVELSRDACSDMDVFLGKLESVYRRAVGERHFHAAVRAVEIQARLAEGHWAARLAGDGAAESRNARLAEGHWAARLASSPAARQSARHAAGSADDFLKDDDF